MLDKALLPGGLVDRLALITFPVMLGRGKRWYSGDPATARSWTLVEQAHSPKGFHFASLVTVETEPQSVENETIETQVRVIAANQGAAIHRLTAQRVSRRLWISLDIEVASSLRVDEAHMVARAASICVESSLFLDVPHFLTANRIHFAEKCSSHLEAALRQELGSETEIDTHIEPKAAEWLNSDEPSMEEYRSIERSLTSVAAQGGFVRDIHNLRIRSTNMGLIVNFHCRLPPHMSVTEAHAAVDQLERSTRSLHPNVARSIGHAEPELQT